MSSSEEAERARALCPPHCAGSVHCPGCPSWSSAAHGLVAGGKGAKKGKAFTLYELPAATGFVVRSKASGLKYNQLCRAAGLLPVGCGGISSNNGHSYDCDAKRYFGSAECVPMPAAWGCGMDVALSSATGWRSLVTFFADGTVYGTTDGTDYSDYLYGANAAGSGHGPRASDALRPVCAKMGPP